MSCYTSWCVTCTSLLTTQLEESTIGEKEPRPVPTLSCPISQRIVLQNWLKPFLEKLSLLQPKVVRYNPFTIAVYRQNNPVEGLNE